MIVLSNIKKKNILYWFFWVIMLTCFDSGLSNDNFLANIISLSDELFILIIFIYTLIKGHQLISNRVIQVTSLFVMCGLIGNYINHIDLLTSLLGVFNVIKPILLFYAFSNIDFDMNDFMKFMKPFEKFFVFFIIGIFLDLLIPSFGDFLSETIFPNYKHGEERLGLRCIQGFFPRSGGLTILALLYYIFYKYYQPNGSKWKYLLMCVVTFLTLKVKDIIAMLICVALSFFRSIKGIHIALAGVTLYGLIIVYSIILPDHFNGYMNMEEDSGTARVALTVTSGKIARDYMPFGVGFGQFGSPTSRDRNSSVYSKYGIDWLYGLNYERDGGKYMVDTFWPMIIGETGILGTIMFVLLLWLVFGPSLRDFLSDTSSITGVLPAMLCIALLITSVAKPSLLGPPNSLLLWGLAGMFNSIRENTAVLKV